MPRPSSDQLLVLHVLAPAEFGGLESVVRLMAAGQARNGHEVVVVPLVRRGARVPDWLESLTAHSVRVEPIVARRFAYHEEVRRLEALCRELRPRVMHTHGYHADIVGAMAAKRAVVPVVATVHGFVGGGAKNRLYEWLQRRAFRDFDAVMPVSRPLADELARAGVPATRLHVVVNAFEGTAGQVPREAARKKLGLADALFHVGWVGRLSQEKGPDVMLRALALVQRADVRLSILGDGPELGRLKHLAAQLGIAGRVTWHGVVSDAGGLLRAFDTVVLSSRAEGTPVVLLEGMAAGVPIVATRVGGIPDVVSAAESLLVHADDPRALAAAIDEIRTNPGAAAARAEAARRRLAERFAVEPWLRQIDEVYAAARQPHASGARV